MPCRGFGFLGFSAVSAVSPPAWTLDWIRLGTWTSTRMVRLAAAACGAYACLAPLTFCLPDSAAVPRFNAD